MHSLSSHQRGLLMTVIGVLVLTPDVLLMRLVEADQWSLLILRSVFGVLALFILNLLIERETPWRSIQGLGLAGLVCGALFAGSNIFFVSSITRTSAANALVILATMPFITALMTVFILKKKLPLRIWLAIAVATVGICIVFGGSIGSGNLTGDMFAFLAAICVSSVFILIAHKPGMNNISAIGVGSFFTIIVSWSIGGTPESISQSDVLWLFINGALVFPIAMTLITYGPKLIPAPEVSLIMLLEMVLGPFWVWLVLAEQPPTQTLVGGLLVILAVSANSFAAFRESSQPAA